MDETGKTIEAAVAYCGKILKKAIALRDENAGDQNRSVLNWLLILLIIIIWMRKFH